MPNYRLVWLVHQKPGLLTHVTLCDDDREPSDFARVNGHGVDELDALRDLWLRLIARDASAEGIAFVADA